MHELIQQSEGQKGSFVHLVRSSSITQATEFPCFSPLFALVTSYWAKISNPDLKPTSDEEKSIPFLDKLFEDQN